MNVDAALKRLYSLQKFGIKLGLENTLNILQFLGNPHNEFRSFHVAGSNGKGSTSSFISSILQENGYKTGLYTSPHFVRFNERIRINGIEIEDNYIVKFISNIDELINKMHPTFFEVTTALAFKYFADNKIDYAVVETGLGGRLDATNVILPVAAIITSISLEHTEILGSSIEAITKEKAGIIKAGIKIFSGKLPDDSLSIIKDICRESKSELYRISDVITEKNDKLYINTELSGNMEINPSLKGNYQKYNAALAAYVVSETLGIKDNNIFKEGIKNVIKNTGIQGRYEIFNEYPRIIFDSAHNAEGVASFINSFKNEEKFYDKKIVIFGAMKDKPIREMLKSMAAHFDEFYFISIKMDRCTDKYDLYSVGMELKLKCFVVDDILQLIQEFIDQNKNQCLVAMGSMYILGDIKSKLLKKKLDIIFN